MYRIRSILFVNTHNFTYVNTNNRLNNTPFGPRHTILSNYYSNQAATLKVSTNIQVTRKGKIHINHNSKQQQTNSINNNSKKEKK